MDHEKLARMQASVRIGEIVDECFRHCHNTDRAQGESSIVSQTPVDLLQPRLWPPSDVTAL